MAAVPGVLLDEVDQDPAQAGPPAVPLPHGEGVDPALGQRARRIASAAATSASRRARSCSGESPAAEWWSQSGSARQSTDPHGSCWLAAEDVAAPEALHEGEVLEEPTESQRARRQPGVELPGGQPLGLAPQRVSEVVEEGKQHRRLVGDLRRVDAFDAHGGPPPPPPPPPGGGGGPPPPPHMTFTMHTAAERPDLWERGLDSASRALAGVQPARRRAQPVVAPPRRGAAGIPVRAPRRGA